MKIVYLSLTGQTKKFVDKLAMPSLRISMGDVDYVMDEDYIVIVPSYDMDTAMIVCRFIEYKNNKMYLRGVAGGGNRNFNTLFCISAKFISKRYNSPLLHCFEFQGTARDVEQLKEKVREIGKSETSK